MFPNTRYIICKSENYRLQKQRYQCGAYFKTSFRFLQLVLDICLKPASSFLTILKAVFTVPITIEERFHEIAIYFGYLNAISDCFGIYKPCLSQSEG